MRLHLLRSLLIRLRGFRLHLGPANAADIAILLQRNDRTSRDAIQQKVVSHRVGSALRQSFDVLILGMIIAFQDCFEDEWRSDADSVELPHAVPAFLAFAPKWRHSIPGVRDPASFTLPTSSAWFRA